MVLFSKGLEGEVAERRTNSHDRPRLDAAESTLDTVKRGRLVGSEYGRHSGGVVRAVDIGNCVVGNLEIVVALNSHLGDGDSILVYNTRRECLSNVEWRDRLRTIIGNVVGILPVDHAASPLDSTLRHGRDTSWPDGELNSCRSCGVLIHAILE
jgi:hypothetical protein